MAAMKPQENRLNHSYKKRRGPNWTVDENERFVEGVRTFGRNWSLVAEHIGTGKTAKQTCVYAMNYRRKSKLFAELSDNDVMAILD